MAGHENISEPEGRGAPAKDPADSLKPLLDHLAEEISGAGARHSEVLHEMRDRLAALSERASAAKPRLADSHSAALERIEAAMTRFAERLSDVEPGVEPTPAPTESPDDALSQAVRDELRQAIRTTREGVEVPPSARTSRIDVSRSDVHALASPPPAEETSQRATAPATAITVDTTWLEARFADIAQRVEHALAAHRPENALLAMESRFGQLEARFDTALAELAARPMASPDVLQAIEHQITELFGQLERTQGQLSRLDAIESQLTALRHSVSDERMSALLSAYAPTDAELSAVAMAAAECAVNAVRNDMAPVSVGLASEPDPRLSELTAMLGAFIAEHRQGDIQTAEALDTMQQAMQHIIDRVEAIESAQTTHHESAMLQGTPLERPSQGRPEVLAAQTTNAPPAEAAEMYGPPVTAPGAHLDTHPYTAPQRAAAEPRGGPAGDPAPANQAPAVQAGELERQALIAMARRAAEKVASAPRDTLTPSAGKAPPSGTSGPTMRRPGVLFVSSLAAFVILGFWLVAGPGLRPVTTSAGYGSTPADASPAIEAPVRTQAATPEEGADPIGNGTDQPAHDEANAKQPQRAGLADRLVGAQTRLVPTTASTADVLSAARTTTGAPNLPSTTAGGARSVELPPAMIGPLSLRHAAAKGDPRAQLDVAIRFAEGKGVPQDFTQAATWYQRAATQGLPAAQYRLAALYERGLGVTADPARARVWYSRAAEQGHLRAMHNLAVLSAGRPGTPPDYPTAVHWFTAAAERGLADSQYNLGILYESGLGLPASNIEAYKWYALAARSGDKDAAKRRDAVRAGLDRASLRAADALVIQWRPKPVSATANDSRAMGQSWQSARR